MLLRIIDNEKNSCILLELHGENIEDSYTIESFSSPFSKNFRSDLDWYFSSFNQALDANEDRDVVAKMIKFGQYLGDYLVEDESKIFSWVAMIEKSGYENLDVRVESSRESFFAELWEFIVLPDSKYVLSACTKSFVRIYVNPGQHEDPCTSDVIVDPLRYDLAVQSPINFVLEDSDSEKEKEKEKESYPLSVMHFIGRTEELSYDNCAYSSFLELLANEGAIDYDVNLAIDRRLFTDKVERRLCHIMHIDCPIEVSDRDEKARLLLSDKKNGYLEVENLIKILLNRNIYVLCIDARYFCRGSDRKYEPYSQRNGLARVAHIAKKMGFPVVIGTSERTDPWISNRCFRSFYQALSGGCTLSSAVTESRKNLQLMCEVSRYSTNDAAFHSWPLLTQYGSHDVSFFSAPQFSSSLLESTVRVKVLERLFGFNHSLFPPESFLVDEKVLFDVKSSLESASATYIVGGEGVGKTHIAHQVAFYLAQAKEIQYGFYLDFDQGRYDQEIVLEMVANAFSLESNNIEEILDKLGSSSSCFIFDNVSTRKSKSIESTIIEFMEALVTRGHFVIATGRDELPSETVVFNHMEITNLHEEHCKILAVLQAKSRNIEFDTTSMANSDLYQTTAGNPFLTTQYVNHLLGNEDARDSSEILEISSSESVVTDYFKHQFSSLHPMWQRLLTSSVEVDGLIWDMLMVAAINPVAGGAWGEITCLFPDLIGATPSFSDGLDLLTQKGFVESNKLGRITSQSAKKFISELQEEYSFDEINREKFSLAYSQLICEGFELLSRQALKNNTKPMIHYLLIHRGSFALHLQRMWLNSIFPLFFAGKSSLDQLLIQAGIFSESTEWSLETIRKSKTVPGPFDKTDLKEKIAWLKLAYSAVPAQDDCYLELSVNSWTEWVKAYQFSEGVSIDLFSYAVEFLRAWYVHSKDWKSCLDVLAVARTVYRSAESWHRYIQALKISSRCYNELSDMTNALVAEKQLLEDVPYEDSPPGYKQKQMLEIVVSRMERGDFDNAEALLDSLRKIDDSARLEIALNNLQAELDFRKKDYESALIQYCSIWNRISSDQSREQSLQLGKRFQELESLVGSDKYEEILSKGLRAETPRPVLDIS